MKNINRLLAAAAILLSAAACHTNEIDPIKPDPVNPGESGLTITANIVKTRVTYNDKDEDYLDQQWEEGDILFGYYGGAVTNKVILKVDGFDEYGDAILKPVNVEGVASLSALAKLDSTVPVDLVYTGKNVSDYTKESVVSYPFDINDGTLTVNMDPQDAAQDGVLHCAQDGVSIPACMHARAYVQTDKNDQDKKSLFFTFVNDCAIIEIYSLTGIREDTSIDLKSGADLTSLSVTNLVLAGEYALGKDGFEFGASEIVDGYDDVPVVTDYVYNFGPNDDWKVNSNAEIMKGDTQTRYLIAVVPNKYTTYITEDGPDESGITVSATIGADSYSFGYGQHDFDAGKCYVIRDAEVVAKTVDDLYFTTVKAAFDHAHEIRLDHPDDNTVTLVKDDIYGLVNHAGIGPIDETIVINYPVTLDLNGCWLYLGDVNEDGYDYKNISESFIVSANGKFTISDPNEGEDMGVIWSDGNTADSIIENFGEVIIENGFIWQFDEDRSLGTEMLIIDNQGSLSLFGGNLSNDSGPVIYSGDGSDISIGDEDGTTGPSIESFSKFKYAISVDSNELDTKFKMTGGTVNGTYGGINLCGSNVTATIFGGEISNSHDEGNAVYVQYGTCNISGENTTIKNGNTDTSSSDNSSALYLDNATATISGGATVDGSSRNHAIYCHNSSCEVSGAATKILGAFESAAVAAVDCIADEEDDKPSFIMLNGTVQTNSIAIHLGKNIKGTISNGTIKSNVNSAIVLSGLSLTIGGTGTPP